MPEQHRLLILGSMHEFVQLVKKARARGWYVVVCDGYADGPAKPFANVAYNINVRDTAAIVEVAKKERVDGIIASFSDVLAECLATIATEAGFEPFLAPEKLAYLRDKSLMKQMFDEAGVPYAKTVRVTRENAAQQLAGLTFPCVTKPANAWGSHGVNLVRTPQEVLDCFGDVARFAEEDYILVEEYNDGYEINMMAWVCNGKPVVLDLADREKSQEDPNALPYVTRITYPSVFTGTIIEEATDILQRVVDFLGYEYGPLCMQFFYQPGRGIQVCECCGRIFGYEHELLELASEGGLCIEDLLLDSAYDKASVAPRLAAHNPRFTTWASALNFHARDGVIARLEGIPEEGGIVKDSLTYLHVGSVVSHEVGDMPYLARLLIATPDREELDAATDALFGAVIAEDAAGNSLVCENTRVTYDGVLSAEL
ncbi:MAG: ATP-grasp domain-containing protein [Coriobacteriia bacterium]|nr:ATP-grasp domain-containing protein [Coriobacteriia bacterium]